MNEGKHIYLSHADLFCPCTEVLTEHDSHKEPRDKAIKKTGYSKSCEHRPKDTDKKKQGCALPQELVDAAGLLPC